METLLLDQIHNNNIVIIHEFCDLLYNTDLFDIATNFQDFTEHSIHPTNIIQEIINICTKTNKLPLF
jgi:hypothetical protein